MLPGDTHTHSPYRLINGIPCIYVASGGLIGGILIQTFDNT